jgi:hypothetical protein
MKCSTACSAALLGSAIDSSGLLAASLREPESVSIGSLSEEARRAHCSYVSGPPGASDAPPLTRSAGGRRGWSS